MKALKARSGLSETDVLLIKEIPFCVLIFVTPETLRCECGHHAIMSSVKTRPLFPDAMITSNIFRGVSVPVLESNYYDP